MNRALQEEIVHAVTVGYRPSQLYPLANYLRGVDTHPDVEEFRDVVEAVYAAMWPLATDKPVTARSLPQAEPAARETAVRILELARRFALSAEAGLPEVEARTGALWAVTMFLLYVVPLAPQQCPIVLDNLARVATPPPWRTYPELFQHFFAELLAARTAGPRTFELVPPSEPHRNVAVTLEWTRQILRLAPDALLPVFPSALSVVALNVTNFIPLVWLRARRRCIWATVEIWDQTAQRLEAVRSVISSRLRLFRQVASPIKDCPTDRFYRETARTIAARLMHSRPCRPAEIMRFAIETLRKLVRKHRTAMFDRAAACGLCRRLVCTPSVAESADQILAVPPAHIRLLAAEADGYERWLLSTGLSLIQSQLWQRHQTDLPVVPALTKTGHPFLLWRSL